MTKNAEIESRSTRIEVNAIYKVEDKILIDAIYHGGEIFEK